MNRETDTGAVGWAGFGTLVGYVSGDHLALLLSVSPWLAQLGMSLFTMAAGTIMVHFLKIGLQKLTADQVLTLIGLLKTVIGRLLKRRGGNGQ